MKANVKRDVTVTLTMTEQEAKVLVTIMLMVNGDPSGPRGVADDLYKLLFGAGINGGAILKGSSGVLLPDTWEDF